MSDIHFLNINSDFEKFHDSHPLINLIDYELGYLEGLRYALSLTSNYGHLHGTRKLETLIKTNIAKQLVLLSEYLQEEENESTI